MSTPRRTRIKINDYATDFCAVQEYNSYLGDYNALVTYCFNAFNRDAERFSLHFHFRPNTRCADDELLRESEWNNGVYANGRRTLYFAHFVRRVPGQGQSRFGRRVVREPTSSPDNPPGEPTVPRTQPPLPRVNEQGVVEPFYPLTYDIPGGDGPTPTPPRRTPVPRSTQPPTAARRTPSRRRNTNSTIVYSLGPPRPSTRYSGSPYFSAPFVFIPLQPSVPRPRTHAQQYMTSFPGYEFHAATADERSALPSRDEFGFDLEFDDSLPVPRQQQQQRQQQEPEPEQESQEQERQTSVAPTSAGSGGSVCVGGRSGEGFQG